MSLATFFYSCGIKERHPLAPLRLLSERTRCGGLRFGLENENIQIEATYRVGVSNISLAPAFGEKTGTFLF